MKQGYRNRYSLIDKQLSNFVFVKNEEISDFCKSEFFYQFTEPFHKVPGAA